MLVRLNKQDTHASELMGADTVKLCEMQGFPPRLENEQQSRAEANIYGFKAEFAVARVLGVDPPTVNVLTAALIFGLTIYQSTLSSLTAMAAR